MEWNGNGMEMEIIISSVWNLCGIEWNVQWNLRERGMEKEWRYISILDEIRMEWNGTGIEWNGNGIKMEYVSVTTIHGILYIIAPVLRIKNKKIRS